MNYTKSLDNETIEIRVIITHTVIGKVFIKLVTEHVTWLYKKIFCFKSKFKYYLDNWYFIIIKIEIYLQFYLVTIRNIYFNRKSLHIINTKSSTLPYRRSPKKRR